MSGVPACGPLPRHLAVAAWISQIRRVAPSHWITGAGCCMLADWHLAAAKVGGHRARAAGAISVGRGIHPAATLGAVQMPLPDADGGRFRANAPSSPKRSRRTRCHGSAADSPKPGRAPKGTSALLGAQRPCGVQLANRGKMIPST